MSFLDKMLGRPLASSQKKKQALSVVTGVPALGLDSLASMAYGPEAALMILLPLGMAGLHYFFTISLAVVAILLTLYFSYQQTTAAYPNGGGAYVVAGENLGKHVGVWAAIALLLDYLLNVAVGISAGVGAIVSAFPALYPHTVFLCLLVLATLAILNLRGARESGAFFVLPTVVFVLCIGTSIVIGLAQAWLTDGHPKPVVAPPPFPTATAVVSAWLILGAFANGLTAMTGVEAVSNAVPLFRKPSVKNAQRTLTIIILILSTFLISLGYLCPTYHIVAMEQNHPGYQTILSQLVLAVTGKGIFYYISIISIFIILTYSAQTSFFGFPRVCRLLAEDNFLPHFFAERGRRLVFSHGIIVLSILSAILIIVFKGITNSLIPLFAVGAFSAFLFSQVGMVVHWLHEKEAPNVHLKLFINGLGAIATAIALCIIIYAKFLEGAWIVIIIAAILAYILNKISNHYEKISHEIEKPLELQTSKLQTPIVIIPIQGWNRVAERAVRFGLLLSEDVTAVSVSTDKEYEKRLRNLWDEKVEQPAKSAKTAVPKLEIINSPYRRIYQPILDFVEKTRTKKSSRLIAVVIPELIEPHWYGYLLHNLHATGLRTHLFLKRDQRTIVITTPWYLDDMTPNKK